MQAFDRTYGKLNCYYIGDIYDCLSSKDKVFKRWQLDLSQKKTNNNVDISPQLYRKIIVTYLEIYFNQLYSKFKAPLYFPFGGMIRLTQSLWKGKKHIYWLWYKKRGVRVGNSADAKKITRGGSFLRNLEAKYMNTFDYTELPEYYKEMKEVMDNNQKYIMKDA